MMLWVFKRDPELHNAQGFIDVPDVLADRLIQQGKAAAQYDSTLMREDEEPGDGIEPARRAERAAATPAPATVAPSADAPHNATQDDSGTAAPAAALFDDDDDRTRSRRTRKP